MHDKQASTAVTWKFPVLLAGFAGVIYAVLTISGWIHGAEGRVALVILCVIGVLTALRETRRPVLHGFVTGFLAAFVAIELQAVFLPLYFANNPAYELVEIPFGLPARLATAIFAPLHATLAGLLTAGFVWCLGAIQRLRAGR